MRVMLMGVLVCIVLSACNLNSPDEDLTPIFETPLVEETEVDLPEPLEPTSELLSTVGRTPVLPLATEINPGDPAPLLPETPVIPAQVIEPTDESGFPANFPFMYEVEAVAGETIIVSYNVVVNNPGQGEVFFIVEDPSGELVANLVVSETALDTFQVEAETTGTHVIRAAAQNLNGDFTVSYNTSLDN